MTKSHSKTKGVVLVIALVMLTVISLLAALSVRNAASSEVTSGAVRTMELATQAAEIALRYCESSALQASPATNASTPAQQRIHGAPLWQDVQSWDSHSSAVIVLPLSAVNQAGTVRTYRRAPECMVEPLLAAQEQAFPLPPADALAAPLATTPPATTPTTIAPLSTFVITARGFGPEVPAEPRQGRPAGTEVWLQSQIEQTAAAPQPGRTALRSTLRTWRQLYMR